MKLSVCLLAMVAVFYSGCVKDPEPNEVDKVSIISIAPSSGHAVKPGLPVFYNRN